MTWAFFCFVFLCVGGGGFVVMNLYVAPNANQISLNLWMGIEKPEVAWQLLCCRFGRCQY